MTYALLDDTFVAKKVLESLGITGVNVKVNLCTMLGKKEIPAQRVHGPVVRRINNVGTSLPKTYSEKKIPFRRNQISTPEISKTWPHLRRITNKIHPYQPWYLVQSVPGPHGLHPTVLKILGENLNFGVC